MSIICVRCKHGGVDIDEITTNELLVSQFTLCVHTCAHMHVCVCA